MWTIELPIAWLSSLALSCCCVRCWESPHALDSINASQDHTMTNAHNRCWAGLHWRGPAPGLPQRGDQHLARAAWQVELGEAKNKTKIFLDKQKYFFELQQLRYTCHCCNHFILMCSFHFAGPVQPRPGPAWGCCCISAPDLHFTNIGPAIIRDKPCVNSKLYPGN